MQWLSSCSCHGYSNLEAAYAGFPLFTVMEVAVATATAILRRDNTETQMFISGEVAVATATAILRRRHHGQCLQRLVRGCSCHGYSNLEAANRKRKHQAGQQSCSCHGYSNLEAALPQGALTQWTWVAVATATAILRRMGPAAVHALQYQLQLPRLQQS